MNLSREAAELWCGEVGYSFQEFNHFDIKKITPDGD